MSFRIQYVLENGKNWIFESSKSGRRAELRGEKHMSIIIKLVHNQLSLLHRNAKHSLPATFALPAHSLIPHDKYVSLYVHKRGKSIQFLYKFFAVM